MAATASTRTRRRRLALALAAGSVAAVTPVRRDELSQGQLAGAGEHADICLP